MTNRLLHIFIIGLVVGADFAFLSIVTAPRAEAYPRHYYRGPAERGVDRRISRRTSRRTARRTTRRVERRHMYYGLPSGYRPYAWGGYNYYVSAGRYFYPYFYGGRTVYIVVETDSSGNPVPPPPSSEIDFY